MESLDELDWKILAALQKQANLPNTELADQVGLTPAPCLRRVKRLTEMGVIRGFLLALDNKQLGYSIAALLEITLNQRTAAATEKFLEIIRHERQVIACHMVTGDCDFVLRILSPSIDSYRKLIWEDLHAMEGIQRIRSSIILDTFKDQLSPTLGNAPKASPAKG